MTIKELSKACGVSEQAIRGWCRKNKVPKAAKGNGFAINETTETAILLHYGAINAKAAKANESSSESKCETMFLIECPLMYMNNPLSEKMPVITSSNKLRTYTSARYYTDAEILEQITKGGADR